MTEDLTIPEIIEWVKLKPSDAMPHDGDGDCYGSLCEACTHCMHSIVPNCACTEPGCGCPSYTPDADAWFRLAVIKTLQNMKRRATRGDAVTGERETLAAALCDCDELAFANPHAIWARLSIADTLLASDWLREVRAKAWDEGFQERPGAARWAGYAHNPYRQPEETS